MTARRARRTVMAGFPRSWVLPAEHRGPRSTMRRRRQVDNRCRRGAGGTRAEVKRFMALGSNPAPAALRPRVLCVDDDRDIGETVQAILGDEGYDVTCLFEITDAELRRVIREVEPDCVLLDSSSHTDYGESWGAAAWIRHLAHAVPVVMFSAHMADSREALANLTERAREAGFAAVILKPFSTTSCWKRCPSPLPAPGPSTPSDGGFTVARPGLRPGRRRTVPAAWPGWPRCHPSQPTRSSAP